MTIGWKDFSVGLLLGAAGMGLVSGGLQDRPADTKQLEARVVAADEVPAINPSPALAPVEHQTAHCPERETVLIRYLDPAPDQMPDQAGASEAADHLVVSADRVDAFPSDVDLFADEIAETEVIDEIEVDEERRWVERGQPVDVHREVQMPSRQALAAQRLAHEQAIEDEMLDAESLHDWAATIDHAEYPEHLPPEVW